MKSLNISEIIKVNSQFGRSVNLERDFYSDISPDSYVLTSTALKSLERIGNAIHDPAATRAWTLTGPFGSGKSAFAFFVAKLLDASRVDDSVLETKLHQIARTNVSNEGIILEAISSSRFIPILVSGAREPLAGAILRGIGSAIKHLKGKVQKSHVLAINKLERSRNVTGKKILELLESISGSVSSKGTGILLIIDELGKLLEFAGSERGESDIFLLQELAEGTRRSARPILFLSILHQAFERYAERLGQRERDEWAKVQGRFEDIPFKEPFEQTLHVLRTVFALDGQADAKTAFHKLGNSLGAKAYKLGLCGSLSKEDSISLLRDCIPLHPLVASLLGPIFRRFGQNERSLFAFLTSSEPYGFVNFISTTKWTKDSHEIVRLDNVYDYLVSSVGSSLISGADGRKWAEVESALLRIPDATALETRILKTIGLFYLLGDFGRFKASRQLLHFSLTDSRIETKKIDAAIDRLKRKSVITERHYNDTFVIWEGSDVDLDARFVEASKNIHQDASLAESLKSYFSHQPIVAKRHSARTGTLRYFDIGFINADETDFSQVAVRKDGDAKVVFVLASNNTQRVAFESKVTKQALIPKADIVLAIPPDVAGLKELLWRVVCWRWVLANTPQLETDRVARKELAARLAYSEQAVDEWLDEWRGTGGSSGCTWYWRNRKHKFNRPRSVQEFLSTVMDELFPQTPIIKNELVNRNALSSAAASARKNLLEAMLTDADKPQLGISGYPPQLSMYFSVFQETTIHREEGGTYGFFPPSDTADVGIRSVWATIVHFLERTEKERLTVGDLFAELGHPPFGLKRGILPLLTTAVFLHYDSEVALYERGNFIPALSMPVLERMCRAPETFSIQLCRITGMRSEVLAGMIGVLIPKATKESTVDLLTVVRPLARFAQGLPDYSQHTSRISPLARNVRRILFSAREPSKLIFELLPEACGLAPFSAKEPVDTAKVHAFSRRLHKALSELKRSYKELLNEIESQLTNAFSLSGTDSREQLRMRTLAVSGFAASVKVKGFILRASDSKLDRNEFLESIGAQIAGRPPAVWRDQDLANFELNMMEIARSFTNLEALVFERLKESSFGRDSELIRINFAQMDGGEHSRVLAIQRGEKELMAEATVLLREALDRSRINGNQNLRLATLARLSLELLEESE